MAESKTFRAWSVPAFIAAVFTAAFLRFWFFVDRYAIDLLTGDDWDDMTPLFGSAGWWGIFRFQHGPRRLGLGLLATDAVQTLSDWNLRTHTFAMLVFLGLACALALLLKRRLFGRFQWLDAVIPLLFFNLNQWELLLYLPLNGILMLDLLVLLALAFTIERPLAKHLSLLALNFLLIHTGYGMFAVGATGLIFLFLLKGDAKTILLSGAAHLAAIAIFFYGYTSAPGLACFQFPWPRPWEYLIFAGLMESRFFGFVKSTGFDDALALALLLITGCALWVTGRSPKEKRHQVIFLLVAFSFLYQINAAVGRICLSVYGSKVSRYATFQIPMMLGFYFFGLQTRQRGLRVALLGGLTALSVFTVFYLDKHDRAVVETYSSQRRAWRECFMQMGNLDQCTQKTGFYLYPDTSNEQFRREWTYLQDHRLHIFRHPSK